MQATDPLPFAGIPEGLTRFGSLTQGLAEKSIRRHNSHISAIRWQQPTPDQPVGIALGRAKWLDDEWRALHDVIVVVSVPPDDVISLLDRFCRGKPGATMWSAASTLAEHPFAWIVHSNRSDPTLEHHQFAWDGPDFAAILDCWRKGEFDLLLDRSRARVQVFSAVSQALLEQLAAIPEERFQLRPRLFEATVAELLHRMGYKVILTPGSGDRGRDVIASIGTPAAPMLMLVECKRYAAHRLVGPEPIARLWCRVLEDKANTGMIVTTSAYQSVAQKESEEKGFQMSLKDGLDFIGWVRSAIGWAEGKRP